MGCQGLPFSLCLADYEKKSHPNDTDNRPPDMSTMGNGKTLGPLLNIETIYFVNGFFADCWFEILAGR